MTAFHTLQHTHGYMIKIQMLGNWHVFVTVAVSQAYVITLCNKVIDLATMLLI